jgi:hypothetical protein
LERFETVWANGVVGCQTVCNSWKRFVGTQLAQDWHKVGTKLSQRLAQSWHKVWHKVCWHKVGTKFGTTLAQHVPFGPNRLGQNVRAQHLGTYIPLGPNRLGHNVRPKQFGPSSCHSRHDNPYSSVEPNRLGQVEQPQAMCADATLGTTSWPKPLGSWT